MAQITWRNVDAPNFNGVMDSYRQFSDLLGRGTQGLSDALGAFRADGQRQADAAILADALKLRDAPSLNAALADGSLLANRTPSAAAAQRLMENASQLVRDDTGRIGNINATRDFDRRLINEAGADALRPIAAELNANPDAAARSEIIRRNQPQLALASPQQQFDLLTGARGVESGNNANALNTVQTRDAITASNDAATAQSLINQAIDRGSNLNPNAALAFYRDTPMSPGVAARFRAAFPSAWTGAVGGTPGVPGSAGGVNPGATGTMSVAPGSAGFGTRTGSGWDRTVGDVPTPKPLTQMTLGEVQDFGKTNLIPGNKGKFGNPSGVGSSASGAFQITGQTLEEFAPKVLGANWRDQPFTPANQEAVAKAIYDARKSGNLKDTWTSLPNSTPGAYKDVPWEQARDQILQGEVGGTLGTGAAVDPFTARANTNQAQNLAAAAATGRTAERSAQDRAGSIATRYVDALNSDANTDQVVDGLLSGAFKGTSRQFLLSKVNDLINKGAPNAAVAGRLMEENITGADRRPDAGFLSLYNPARVAENVTAGIRKLTPGASPNLGNGKRLNDAGITDTLAKLNQENSPILQEALAYQQRKAKTEQVNTARDNLQKAQDAVTMWEQRVNLQPGARDSLVQARASLAQAQAAFNAVRVETALDPGYNPTGRKPVAVTTPASDEERMNRAILGAW